MRCPWTLLVAVTLVCACDPPPPAEESNPPAQTKKAEAEEPPDKEPDAAPTGTLYVKGTLAIPGGTEIGYFARIGADGKGRLSIPKQGADKVELADVKWSSESVSFSLGPVDAHWSGTFASGKIECAFKQRDVEIGCSMEEATADEFDNAIAREPRAQDPKPPFPYDAIEVGYENDKAKVHLAGTLTVPKGDKHPAVLLISGSGAQDRDETIGGHKPFWVLADHLSRKGVAVLRVDDRGVGESSGIATDPTMEDFAEDVHKGVAFLAAHPRIDPQRIGLIGHSEGGVIAPLVASKNKDVKFIVMLAGPGVSGAELLVEQVGALARTSGLDAKAVAQAKSQQRKAMDVLLATKDDAEAKEKLKAIMDPTGAAGPALDPQLEMLVGPWFRTFVGHDPAPVLAKLEIPILAMNGALDVQVVADQNLTAIKKAVKKNPNARVEKLAGLNHLFQTAKTGAFTEYETIEETFAPSALDMISSWVVEQAK